MFVNVIVRCGSKFVVGCIGNVRFNIIIMVCVNVIGDFMFFMFIVKGKIKKFLFGFNIVEFF